MRSTINPWSVLSALCATGLLLLASCEKSPQADKPVPDTEYSDEEHAEKEPASLTAEELRKEAGEAAEATKQYLSQKKDEFMASMNSRLENMDETMADMKAKGAKLKGEAKEDWDTAMVKLETKRSEFAAKMETWEDNSGEAWDEAKAGLEKAWAELNDAQEEAMQELEENNLKASEDTAQSKD